MQYAESAKPGKTQLESAAEPRDSISSLPTINLNLQDYSFQNNPTSTHELAMANVPSTHQPRLDKASQVLGVKHHESMTPLPRNSMASAHSASLPSRNTVPPVPHTPTSTLAALYVVSGLPKSPHTWNLADADSITGVHHSEGAVGRFWRAEVLGHTVSAGVGGKRKKRGGGAEVKGVGALTKQETGKMLAKTLKLSFTREVEIIASTLQPASTVHSFTFSTPNATSSASPFVRNSLISRGSDQRMSAYANAGAAYDLSTDPFAPPTGSPYLAAPESGARSASTPSATSTTTWHGVCLTVWSHADAERSAAIRRALEATNNSLRARTESAHSVTSAKLRSLRAERRRRGANMPNHTVETTEGETDADGISESEYDRESLKNLGNSTLFLPGDTVFWLPYALTLVSKHPVYDLMRDYLTLSWARFSKDVAAHTLQIAKILASPAPRSGDVVRLDASASGPNSKDEEPQGALEVVSRFPGGLDFGKGLVDMNFTMWPLFKALSLDNILTICEIAMAPTGRVLFLSRYPAMLGIAVSTIRYLVELRGWNGIAHPIAHCRDARIFVDDPGPWIIGLSTEARYSVRPSTEVCVCDIDINYVNCASPPLNSVSVRQQREKFKQRLAAAFESYYHPDHAIPSEFKEAFPAGRFRPLCKIQAKRGVSNASAAVISEMIKPPEWWNGPRVIQAIDSILVEKMKRPSFFKRLTGSARSVPKLTTAEINVQLSIRKRAAAFVDARDDLETKIGRLSRRLNFLVTESDLWREKFITFEQYAEKLSTEATDLRTRINKEQRESKRLSSMITATANEKQRLESKLRDKEKEHHSAIEELEVMRIEMERMEDEREQMVLEVEAQIERALASMVIDEDDDGYRSLTRPTSPRSRPLSPLRARSAPGSRRPSFTNAFLPMDRTSFATDTTAAEPMPSLHTMSLADEQPIAEEEEADAPATAKANNRKSKLYDSSQEDGADAGISEKSDKIALKVLQIQQKLEMALGGDIHRSVLRDSGSESERSSRGATRRPRPPRNLKLLQSKAPRPLSLSPTPESPAQTERGKQSDHEVPVTPTLSVGLTSSSTSTSTVHPPTPGLTTDESDADFQSAHSASPRNSGSSFEQAQMLKVVRPTPAPVVEEKVRPRDRVLSDATARKMKLESKAGDSLSTPTESIKYVKVTRPQVPKAQAARTVVQ